MSFHNQTNTQVARVGVELTIPELAEYDLYQLNYFTTL